MWYSVYELDKWRKAHDITYNSRDFAIKHNAKAENEDFQLDLNVHPDTDFTNSWKNLEFNILLSDESILETVYKGNVNVGEKIFVIDSSKFQNGIYYLAITTSFQKILRKIIVDN